MCYNIPATRVAGAVPVANKENIGYHKPQALRGMVSYTGRTCNWQLRGASSLEQGIMALNAKRRIFIEEYLRCWNATRAATLAGYAHPGQQGYRLLQFPEVKSYISKRLEMLRAEPPEVAEEKIKTQASIVYLIREEHGLVKIGKTINIKRRLLTLSNLIPYDLELVLTIKTEKADMLETYFHQLFEDKRVKGEWFALSNEDIEVVRNKWQI